MRDSWHYLASASALQSHPVRPIPGLMTRHFFAHLGTTAQSENGVMRLTGNSDPRRSGDLGEVRRFACSPFALRVLNHHRSLIMPQSAASSQRGCHGERWARCRWAYLLQAVETFYVLAKGDIYHGTKHSHDY
jgi:hypothetical protein